MSEPGTPGEPQPDDARPRVTVTYADRQLRAQWTTSPFAGSYRVDVRDAQDVLVYTATVDAASYAPPVVLASAAFAPQPSRTYVVEVTALSRPSDAQSITVVDLGVPTVRCATDGGALRFAWTAVDGATAYDLELRDAAGAVAVARPGLPTTALPLTAADGVALDTPYTAIVRARSGGSLGGWSAPLAVELLSAASILAALRARLLATRPAPDAVALDERTLPDEAAAWLATFGGRA